MSSIKFKNLVVGDRVQLSDSIERVNFGAGVAFEGSPVNPREIVVTAVHLTSGNDVFAIEDENGKMYPAAEDYEIKVLEYANHLPNADYIEWSDWDRNSHIAFRDGHPLNNAWVYNGRRYDGSDLAVLIQNHRISILTLQGA